MRIIEMTSLTKKKAKVLFEGGSSLVLYHGEIKRLGWSEDEEVDTAQYEKVRSETVEKRAKLYAMHLLQDQDRTEKELLDKLKRAQYDPDICRAALEYVKRFGYVDDERYAENYIHRCKGVKSARVIRQELVKRGIDSEVADSMLDEDLDDYDEEKAVLRLLKKRRYHPVSADEEDHQAAARERDRQLRYLASKGFSYATVRRVLDHWEDYQEES